MRRRKDGNLIPDRVRGRDEAVSEATDHRIGVYRLRLFVIGEHGRYARCKKGVLLVMKQKKRLFAESVARQHQTCTWLIPNSQSKHAPQVGKQRFAPFLVSMANDFAVR